MSGKRKRYTAEYREQSARLLIKTDARSRTSPRRSVSVSRCSANGSPRRRHEQTATTTVSRCGRAWRTRAATQEECRIAFRQSTSENAAAIEVFRSGFYKWRGSQALGTESKNPHR